MSSRPIENASIRSGGDFATTVYTSASRAVRRVPDHAVVLRRHDRAELLVEREVEERLPRGERVVDERRVDAVPGEEDEAAVTPGAVEGCGDRGAIGRGPGAERREVDLVDGQLGHRQSRPQRRRRWVSGM